MTVPAAIQDIVAAAPELAAGVAPLRPLRVGIVGLGRMGAAHTAVLSMLPDVVIAGAADAAPGAARRLQGMGFAFPVRPQLDALLADRLDAVWVCTPPDSHLPIARQCRDAGTAVFIEKPLAHALPAAEELAALAASGPPIACGYTLAFWPSFVAAGRLLQAGVIGTAQRVVSSMHISQVFRPQKGWMFEPQRSGGGVVANLSSHLLFVLQSYFGVPTSVRATWHKRYGAVEDEVEATFSAPGCADISFASSWSVPGYPMSVTTVRIEGEHGVLEVDNDTVRLELHRAAAGLPAGTIRLSEADLPQPAGFYFNGEAYALEDAHVLRWVSGGPPPPVTAAAGLRVQRLMTAVYESAAAGGAAVVVAS